MYYNTLNAENTKTHTKIQKKIPNTQKKIQKKQPTKKKKIRTFRKNGRAFQESRIFGFFFFFFFFFFLFFGIFCLYFCVFWYFLVFFGIFLIVFLISLFSAIRELPTPLRTIHAELSQRHSCRRNSLKNKSKSAPWNPAANSPKSWETHDDKQSHTTLSKHAGVYILFKPS